VDTRTHTPVRPSRAERARTVLAAAASASVHWDGGRVDLLGCHHDDPFGDVILTLEATSTLVSAVRGAREASEEDIAAKLELTELCAVSVRERVLSRVSLSGRMSMTALAPTYWTASSPSVSLRVQVSEVTIEDVDGAHLIPTGDYRRAQIDPLHLGAAEQLQHLAAHHPEAITTLSRLCSREAMLGVVRVLPIALDRYGIVLRAERVRGHRDVRLSFRRRIDSGTEAAIELRQLLVDGSRRRPCAR
jgi:hypothetical protein